MRQDFQHDIFRELRDLIGKSRETTVRDCSDAGFAAFCDLFEETDVTSSNAKTS